ncbi:CHAD domain-containing protein [Qingshengfaniella alkalisoli]|uniref:CHAD domain-containing protein n=1 Tax=Qingshengfaniella alkalisoli TaxID=2599296 RepID=A0A5B8J545_9RHOB|nr:CHAD domain-containing protein [Qingshengfaniella alkalisoli]QDY69440.1 CHAD domain-containing protein [Qingshengfaniella alkalisoli]
MNEIELKFLIADTDAPKLRNRIKNLPGGDALGRASTLRSIYFDTDAKVLKSEGIALRLRNAGREWLQTVKAKQSRNGGLQSVLEFECAVPGGKLVIDAIEDDTLRDKIALIAASQDLVAVCETEIKRTKALIHCGDGSEVEVALDLGHVKAGERSEPLAELELELKSGSLSALFSLAATLLPEGGLRFSRMSKSERGYLLADEGHIGLDLSPRNSSNVSLLKEQPVELAARDVFRECFEQITHNIEVVCDNDDPEGPHQLRVGLRRFRSAATLLKSGVGGVNLSTLKDEAKWLGREVGTVRDLDVTVIDLLEPEAARHPQLAGFNSLREALIDHGNNARHHLRQVLRSERVHRFELNLAQFIETRGWLDPDDHGQTQRLATPINEVANSALAHRWKKTTKRAQHIEALSTEQRHELRKELKKLRYAAEFFGPLYGKKKVNKFTSKLKKLQDMFGSMNDLAMAETLLSGSDPVASGDPDAQRAVGWILGSRTVQAEFDWTNATALWNDLSNLKRFWE